MTSHPTSSASFRGAVDLSTLSQSTPAPGPAAGNGLVIEGTDGGFQAIVTGTQKVPAVVVLWSQRMPASADFVQVVTSVAASYEGRFQVVSVDVDVNPGLLQAFQVQSVPMTLGLVAGQPVPLFLGAQSAEQVRVYVDELLKLAAEHNVTGRVALEAPGEAEVEPELPPLHQEAFDAIERDDLDAAAAAYTKALALNPADGDAAVGLAQVKLMQRTAGVDLQAARAAAAEDPTDVAAQMLMADLDVLGGHVEDAFVRLIDTVRATEGDERDTVREHLVELFAVVGAHDERVLKARRALMSALF
ncbi:MAG TPA: tetratricopeptide repeat protein [Dermatophilaceae bacterium]|nr:tetratricopeptide repeat protein [Dermatophilaceae bacterium]